LLFPPLSSNKMRHTHTTLHETISAAGTSLLFPLGFQNCCSNRVLYDFGNGHANFSCAFSSQNTWKFVRIMRFTRAFFIYINIICDVYCFSLSLPLLSPPNISIKSFLQVLLRHSRQSNHTSNAWQIAGDGHVLGRKQRKDVTETAGEFLENAQARGKLPM